MFLQQEPFSQYRFLSSPYRLELAEGFTIGEVAPNEDYDLVGSRAHPADDAYERVNGVADRFLSERREPCLDGNE